jgi:hypothetical protein
LSTRFLSASAGLSRLFRRRFLERLAEAHRAAKLQFFGERRPFAGSGALEGWLKPLRQPDWGASPRIHPMES